MLVRNAKAWLWARRAVLALGVVVLAFAGWDQTVAILRHQPLGIDFLPMWAAGHEVFIHPARVYDFIRLSRFEHPLEAQFVGLRPFVYPPTALLAFAPFGRAPFALANAVWTVAGLVIIVATMSGRLKSTPALALLAMVLSPASVLVLITGQVTFLIAALGVIGLLCLKARPGLAGVLFGLAAVIKPQALVLLPVALVATGQWRTFASTAATGILAALAATLVFGLRAWFDWLAAVPRFEHWALALPGLQRGMITPTALGISMGLDPGALTVWRLGFGIGAVAMVWSVFRATEDPARRLTALFGGGLFISPYAMHYDAALLAPAAALMLTHRQSPGAWMAALGFGVLLCFAAIPHWGAAAVTAFILAAAFTPETAFAGRFDVDDLGAETPQQAGA
jgi:alpha-1,2-mannosyltransferase